jgi:Flp pilus assembly protein TadB
LLNAPRWVLSLMAGVWFGAFMTIWGVLQGDRWQAALIGGAVGGLIFGAVMGPFAHRMYARQRQAVGTTSRDVERAAGRASWRGPVPDDPEVRAVALKLIDHQLGELRRRRTLTLVSFASFSALYVVIALAWSPWWWLAAAFFAVMLAMTVGLPGHLRRRADLLRKADSQPV